MDYINSRLDYKKIFKNSPAAKLIIDIDGPQYTILDANDAYLNATNSTRDNLIGQSVFGAFPSNPSDNDSKNIERTIFSFEQAIKTKTPHVMRNYRYDIPIPGTNEFEERYWTTSNTPILDEEGNVQYFIHSPENVTQLYQLAQREKQGIEALKIQRRELHAIFMQAPVGIGIFKTSDYIVDLINPNLCALYGKTAAEMLGKPVFEVLNHTKGQGFEALLDKVRLTGMPYLGSEIPVPLHRNGKLETAYVNFVYEPFKELDGSVSGVIAIATEVTDQVLAKQQIEKAQESARLAVDAVGLGTFDLNIETGELNTSMKFAQIFGFDNIMPLEVYTESFHKDDRELRAKAHKEALVTGNLVYEIRVVWPDKTIHWVKLEGKIFYDDNKKPLHILGTLLDITNQQNAKERERKLITLVDNSVDLMSILNLDGTNDYINLAGRQMLGFKNELQVNSIPIGQLQSHAKTGVVENEILPTVLKIGNWAGELKLQPIDAAEALPVFINCTRIDDPVTGKPIAIGAVMRDLRPGLAAKQALAASEQLLRNITTAAPTGLWKTDENGAFNYVNQTWIDWTGISFEENMGFGWMEAIVTEDRDFVKDNFLNNLRFKTNFEAEYRINHMDGTVHWCFANSKPHYKEDGSFSGFVGACVDISERKFLQQQKDNFLGIASHELKTPVTSIKAYTQVLQKMMEQRGELTEAAMIAKMDKQLNRLVSLIGDLLDVTKMNSGKMQFNEQKFEFNDCIKELVEDLQRTTEKHVLIEDFLPTGIVFGDKERIGQVITNLITNAVKYSPGKEKIIVHTYTKGEEVILCVEDFGIGIPQSSLEKVFEQFYRVSGDMQHTFPGLGLGLYISSEIIKRAGGRIWVNSSEGKGSSFCFALPLFKD